MKLIELLEATEPKQYVRVCLGDNEIIGTPDNLRTFMDQSLLQNNISDIHVFGSFLVVNIISPVILER